MPSLENPPTWTVPIAEITGWFNWDALGAIGSVGALFFTIMIATRDIRDRRERNASLITAVMHPIGVVINVLEEQWDKGRRKKERADVVFNRIIQTQLLEEMRGVMDEVTTKELPTARAMDAFVAARSAIKNIGIEGKDYADTQSELLDGWVPKRTADLRRYHSTLANEALRFVSKARLVKMTTSVEPKAEKPTEEAPA